jgi:hypothetical protein
MPALDTPPPSKAEVSDVVVGLDQDSILLPSPSVTSPHPPNFHDLLIARSISPSSLP